MYDATLTPPVTDVNESTRAATEDAVLNPRFYTTDFAEMDQLDVSRLQDQWDALVAEFRSDPNKNHFKRTPEFSDFDWTGWDPNCERRLSSSS